MRITLLLALWAGALSAAAPVQTNLFINGDNGYNNFRIPALIVTQKGTLLAFCEGRAKDSDTGNVDVVFKRSTDQGSNWSPLRVLADFGDDAIENATPVVDRSTGLIWLLLTSNPGNVDEEQMREAKAPGTRTVWVPTAKTTASLGPGRWRSRVPPSCPRGPGTRQGREMEFNFGMDAWSFLAITPISVRRSNTRTRSIATTTARAGELEWQRASGRRSPIRAGEFKHGRTEHSVRAPASLLIVWKSIGRRP